MAEDAGPPLSDPLLERLERLAARQRRSQTGRPLSPPTSPQTMDSRDAGDPQTGRRRPPPSSRTRRRHPSRGARVGALLASCAGTGGLALYFAGADASSANASISGAAAPVSTTTSATSEPTTSSSTSNTTATTAAWPTTATTDARSVAAFDGDKIQTRYGPLQVQAQVKDGSLVAVAVIEYPSEAGKSVRINQRALPKLQSEALTAQSAQVHSISGATYTSTAYVMSLQSAIDDARAAGALPA